MDEELVLKRALDAVGVAEVVDRGAARGEARLKRGDHGVPERRDLRALEQARLAQRVDRGAKQRLVGVDVADARDPALVEQDGLDRRAAVARLQVQVLGRELGAERLDPEARVEEGVELRAAERELAGAEAARVAEGDDVAIVELQAHAHVGRVARRVVEQVAGHAQVHEQEHLAGGLEDEVLAPPVQALDLAALERVAQRLRVQRLTPARVQNLERAQRAPLHERREAAADRLDLGQLGHRVAAYGVTCSRPACARSRIGPRRPGRVRPRHARSGAGHSQPYREPT